MEATHEHEGHQHGDGHCCQGKGAKHEGGHGEGHGHCGRHKEHAHAGAHAAEAGKERRCCQDKG